MNTELQAMLAAVELGAPQNHENVTVFPLSSGGTGTIVYLTLGHALEAHSLAVTEVSQTGSVPELKVVNQGTLPVLLLDGEELVGAKQNRVLNTSILLPAQSETTIPVSCTEQGRWAHVSPAFADSGVVMAHKVRAAKSRSVSDALAGGAGFQSDQGEVWHEIQALHAKAQTSSPTGAMRDVFEAHQAALAQGIRIFRLQPGQRGLLVLINGQVVGLDWVSRAEAYEQLHPKLVQSYVIEALVGAKSAPLPPEIARQRSATFMEEGRKVETRRFPSVGRGEDLRCRDPHLAGSALVVDGELIHAALFGLDGDVRSEEPAPMSSLSQRRRRFRAQ